MAKNITVEDGGFVHLEVFRDLVDIDKVVYYELKSKKDGRLILKFYDKKGKLVKPYVK